MVEASHDVVSLLAASEPNPLAIRIRGRIKDTVARLSADSVLSKCRLIRHNSRRAAFNFTKSASVGDHRGVDLISVSYGQGLQARIVKKRLPAGLPMLNSARQPRTSPRRGRRVEWSD